MAMEKILTFYRTSTMVCGIRKFCTVWLTLIWYSYYTIGGPVRSFSKLKTETAMLKASRKKSNELIFMAIDPILLFTYLKNI